MKPPDNSRRVLTWIQDANGNESWQFDHYSGHGWCEARAWDQIVLFWKEEDPAPDYEEGE